jgi:hypothetical protein
MKNENTASTEPLCVQRARALVDVINQSDAVKEARRAELDSLQYDSLLAQKMEPEVAADKAADYARISTLLQMAEGSHRGAKARGNQLAGEIIPLLVEFDRRISEGNRRNLEAAREHAAKKLDPFFDVQHLPAAVMLSEVFLREVAFASNRQPAPSYYCDSFGPDKDGKERYECRSLGALVNIYDRQKTLADAVDAHAVELARALK